MRCGLPRGGCAGLLGALADRHEGFSPAFGGVPQGRGCPRFVGRGLGLQGLPRRILLTELLGVSTISAGYGSGGGGVLPSRQHRRKD